MMQTEAPPSSSRDRQPSGGHHSILAADLKIDGALQSRSPIAIEGEVRGNITGPDISVKADARIRGDLDTMKLVLAGYVDGHVTADKVNILPSGVGLGSITYTTLTIAAGGIFEGEVRRKITQPTETPSGSSVDVERPGSLQHSGGPRTRPADQPGAAIRPPPSRTTPPGRGRRILPASSCRDAGFDPRPREGGDSFRLAACFRIANCFCDAN